MNKTKPRISSILKTCQLDHSVTGIQAFDLAILDLLKDLEFELPTNIRLGHLVEKVVSELIKRSANYRVLHENTQLIKDKKTIGEIDFIIEKIKTKQLIHLELAYKFYLFDPSLSSQLINNWIGPNRNDSLHKKLEKLKQKQFPLLYHEVSRSKFKNIEIDQISQTLCFLVSLFIPYDSKVDFPPVYKQAIKGYYMNLETFLDLHQTENLYHIPSKKEWGIDPSENKIWSDLNVIKSTISTSIKEKQALLCWQKHKSSYTTFFIVWW